MTLAAWYIPPSDFLGRMPVPEREALLSLTEPRNLEKGDYVFQVGDPGNYVYFLETGRAKIFQLSPAGKELILWFCFPGEVFGIAELPRSGRREVYAQTCTQSRVLRIRREEFKRFLTGHPETATMVIELLSCRLRVLGDMLLNLATEEVSSRVVKLLIRLAARYGTTCDGVLHVDMPLTHQEMADMIGASRQSVTTVLNSLKRRGLLSINRHCIHIENEAGLERLAARVAG
jgi:CRP/FNR family transcriptional regulator, cyclic AMP receptor protein